ncbi:hypothetical protein KN1_10420 [Stygiolobus caldivivus]|uniref:Uncharacterized protein n=1 Tax=Stygiolobus caldivivus TaxID=2824673 RepID=A0A8D5U583_9CREN|nr:hypothetical protein KN1_10420 [Stygiolobus caldivivus]
MSFVIQVKIYLEVHIILGKLIKGYDTIGVKVKIC